MRNDDSMQELRGDVQGDGGPGSGSRNRRGTLGLATILALALLSLFVWRHGVAEEGVAGDPSGAAGRADGLAEGATDGTAEGATDGTAEGATDGTAEGVTTQRARELEPLPVTAVVAERGPFVLTVYGTGRAEAVQRAVLSSAVGERVERVLVAPGSEVRRGTLLVALDSEPFELAVAEAEAQQVRAEVDYERQLFRDESADSTKRARVSHLTGRTEAELRLERRRRELRATEVRAPFSGVVASVEVQAGERIGSEQPLVSLVSLGRIRVPVEVLESDFPQLSVGGSADVRFAALPGARFRGRIESLGPEIDPATGTGLAFVELENPEGRIRPGMYAEALLEAGTFGDRISVPREALLERDRKLLVFRAKSGRAEWTYVETGLETDDRVELLSGVASGDSVLVEGHLTLAHGAPVRARLRAEGAGR